MDVLPLHPRLVHLPIALALLMPLVSFSLLAAWTRGLLPRRAWLAALGLQLLLVVSAVAAMRTGEADEERVESVVAEAAIEAHEEAAEAFTWAAGGVLAIFVAAAVIPAAGAARTAATIASAATLAVLFLGWRVGHAGGELVYVHGAASAWSAGTGAAPPSGGAGRGEHDDD